MKIVRGFLTFWYDFFIGDAWELAAGVVITVLIVALLARSPLVTLAWLVFPIGILACLVVSVLMVTRKKKA